MTPGVGAFSSLNFAREALFRHDMARLSQELRRLKVGTKAALPRSMKNKTVRFPSVQEVSAEISAIAAKIGVNEHGDGESVTLYLCVDTGPGAPWGSGANWLLAVDDDGIAADHGYGWAVTEALNTGRFDAHAIARSMISRVREAVASSEVL